MMNIRRGDQRGHFNHGWLDTYHTFSFGDYRDPQHMGFRTLRVINEDRIEPGMGFGTHPHRDMEIITVVLSGRLEHRDSMGNGEVIGPGEVQAMTAGTGITHSEFNPSATEPVHLMQIWIRPEQSKLSPGYAQKLFVQNDQPATLLVSPDGEAGSLRIHQQARVYRVRLASGERIEIDLKAGGHGWLQVTSGEIQINGETLYAGDGAALSEESRLTLESNDGGEALAFDLN